MPGCARCVAVVHWRLRTTTFAVPAAPVVAGPVGFVPPGYHAHPMMDLVPFTRMFPAWSSPQLSRPRQTDDQDSYDGQALRPANLSWFERLVVYRRRKERTTAALTAAHGNASSVNRDQHQLGARLLGD